MCPPCDPVLAGRWRIMVQCSLMQLHPSPSWSLCSQLTDPAGCSMCAKRWVYLKMAGGGKLCACWSIAEASSSSSVFNDFPDDGSGRGEMELC